jgi:hypothetical protein
LMVAICLITNGQNTVGLKENEPITEGGLKYGYTIENSSSKSIKGDEYDRFTIEVFVTNVSGSHKIFPFVVNQQGVLDVDPNNLIAEFNVRNANGRRLTSKGAKIEAAPVRQMVKIEGDKANAVGNNGIIQALLGNGIRANETIKKRIIVLVEKGTQPEVSVKMTNIPAVM